MAKYRITPSSKAIIQLPISIGHKAEKGVEAIEFDLTAWVETYGSGTLTVIMRRWGDAIPYPIALEIDENNKATWTLSDTDTAKAGMAYAQLSYVVGDEVVKKSDIYTFRVMDSLTGEGEPPEAYESWLEQLTHLAAEAMAEVLDIEGIVTDKTLTVDGGIADAKATGDALALKADKSTTYTKTEVDQMIEDVEVETDTTLEIAGAPADAKTVGDELTGIKADLDTNTVTIGDEVFNETELSTTTDLISEGWKLTNDGYRVADAGYKLVRFRVSEGDYVKVESDHKWQFQNSSTVTATGTTYRVGITHNDGAMFAVVPATVTYVVVSIPLTSNTHVYKLTSVFDELETDIGNSVKVVSQNFTDAQKEQARNNIDALPSVFADDVKDNTDTITNSIYTIDSELTSVQTSEGWKLTDDGYRVEDANYQILRFRVFAGDLVKVVSDHKWQFQTSTTVTASGTLYRVGRTRGAGAFYMEVPETVTYVVLTTQINGSDAHVYKVTSDIDDVVEDVNGIKSDSESNFSAVLNAYTSQVSDIIYPGSVTHIAIGIDTTNEKFVSGSQHALVIPIVSGTSIRVTKPQTVYCQICFTSTYPAVNVPITHRTSMNSIVNTEFVAESQPTDNYLVIYTHTTEVAVADCTFAYSQTARGTVNLLPQLDTHMINLLKYRPVGKVSKAYIALSCDDGHNSLATYTLPRIQYWNNYYNTNIPLHMALFDNSPVFANADYTALVTDMCENHNCSIGIHGTQPYEVYSSSTSLYAYLKKQWDTIIDKTGVTPTSVIYPHSSYNDQIMVMTAGFCGICGASGSDPSPYTYKDDHDLYFYVGEKSNCYEVYRLSIKDTRIGNANEAHRIIDYAIAHNLIICPYFHDDDFTEYSEATNEFNKAMLDAFIQYGMEQSVEFINFGDIPKLL